MSSPPVFYVSEAGFATDCNNLCGTVSVSSISFLTYVYYIDACLCVPCTVFHVLLYFALVISLEFHSTPVGKVRDSVCFLVMVSQLSGRGCPL